MLDFLSLGLGGPMVISLGFAPRTCLVGWAHVTQMINASQLKSPNVLRNPTLPYTVDFLTTDHAPATR